MGMFTEWRDDEIAKLQQQLQEARAEIERLVSEIENQQYTITCASEENQQLKESLAEARAEIERRKADYAEMNEERLQWLGVIMKQEKLIEQLRRALSVAKGGLSHADYVGIERDEDTINAALSAAERIKL